MARQSSFPPTAFLILGIPSVAASIVFMVRSIAVEAIAERIWSQRSSERSGSSGWAAYWSARRNPIT